MTPAGGLIHGVAFYSSDEEFVATCAPFCREGLQGGGPTIVRVQEHHVELLLEVLGGGAGLVLLPNDTHCRTAPETLATLVDLVGQHSGGSRRPARLLGELPPQSELSLDAWLRYEAVVNRALDPFPVSALCMYGRRTVSEAVRADLLRTHNVVASPGGGECSPNPAFEPLEGFLENRSLDARDPMEDAPVDAILLDPEPAPTRREIARLAHHVGLDPAATNVLVVCVNEILTNAMTHGRRPVVVQAWGKPRRVVVAVTDSGTGPGDPCVGLLVGDLRADEGGRGLWLTHQLCPETALSVGADGFTVRVAVGAPED